MSDADRMLDWFDKMVDAEIEKRTERGKVLAAHIPKGIQTFMEFCSHPLIDGLDFITAHQAWEEYSSAKVAP